MSGIDVQVWPRHMLRTVSSSFTLGSLNAFVQPIFQNRRRPFGDPFEDRFSCTFQSPPLGEKESYAPGTAPAWLRFRPSFREAEGRIASLRGARFAIRIFDPFKYRPAYNIENAPTLSNWSGGEPWSGGKQWAASRVPPFVIVDEAAAAGAESIVVKELPVSIARVLRIGDPFEGILNGIRPSYGEYHTVAHDAKSNASGKCRVYFSPGLRGKLLAGDIIRLHYPTTVMVAVDDGQGQVQRGLFTGSFGMTLIEVLPGEFS